MIEFTIPFIISQILMSGAIISDFISLQFKERKKIYSILTISAALISAHYFLLGQVTAGIIVFFSFIRFITCIFTTNKKYLYIFLGLNTLVLLISFSSFYDLLIYCGSFIFIIGNFEKDKKLMRKKMMVGTSLILLYNIIILTPMGIIAEIIFLSSNIIGYYRHHYNKSLVLE